MKDKNGSPIGTANDNPLLDTKMYEVNHIDGRKQALAADIIAENIFATADDMGQQHLLLDTVIDHREMSIEKYNNIVIKKD